MKGSQIQPQICGYLEPKHQENRRISLTSPIFTRRKSKREWIVLDEDALKLVAFQDEESANRPKKEPLYSISLVNAVFGIELDNPLTFYIVSGRKYTYQAETHNGMLTWLSCLQACRDERNVAIRSDSGSEVAENVAYSTLPRYQRHISEHHLLRNLPKTYSFTSVKSGILKIPNTNTETNVNRLSIRDDGANSVFEHSPGPTSPFSEDTGFFIGEKASVAGSSMPAPNVTNRNNSDDSNFSAFEEPHPNLRLELQQSLEMVEKLQKQNQHLEEEVRDLRMDYSSLLQTCCMYKLDGSMETGQPANFIITNRHKDRISRILEAARKEDPRLPPTSLLSSQSGHTDSYGFQEIFTNVDMTILYVTSRLLDVYTLTSPAEELKIMKWKDFLHMDFATIPRYKLKELCRQGIPGELREQVWTKLIELGVGKIQQEVGPRYYQTLVARVNDSQIDSSHRRQIMLDVLRTFPNHIAFNRPEGFGVQQMQEVLQAFTLHNRAVGYCQGMNFIAGNATLFLDKETTFWLLVLFVEHHFPPNYFNAGLIAAQADQNVLRELLGRYCPELSASLQTLEVDISTITFNWFIAVFVNSVPISTLLRIWDVFLLEGVKVLFRISIALLIRHQKVLLRQTDTLAFWKSMKTTASLAYDFDELLKIAFGGFKMIKRKELRYRQEGQRRELEKRIRQSSLFNDSSPNMKNNIVAEACAPKPSRLFCVSALGEASPSFLMCQEEGQHCGLKLCNTDEDVFYPMNFKFDAPILCAAWMDDRRLLLGSAEGYIYAFSVEQRMNSWELKMPSCVTAIAIGRRDDGTQHAFVGMANGTLSLIVDLTCEMAPRDQYSQILGFIAVSSIAIVEDQVWCACGCVVEVFNVKTFDHVSKITVSDDPLDSVLCLAPCSNGVWISIAGKTVLDLWSTSTFQPISCCNVQEYLPSRNLGQDADADENPDRVTAVLTNQSNLFIGTGSGVVLIYKILKWKNQAMIQSRSRSTVYRRSATIDDDVDVSKRQDWDTPHGSFAGKDDRDGNANNSSVESVDRKHSKSSLQDFDNSLPPKIPLDFQNGSHSTPKVRPPRSSPLNLLLASRSQVTESPIRAFIQVINKKGVCVVSFSEFCTEDDAVLMWMLTNKGGNKWTNVPLLEKCPADSAPILPAYLKSAALRKLSTCEAPPFPSSQPVP